MADLPPTALQHFRTFGWLRIESAFSTRAAALMCDVIWDALRQSGIRREDPSTWTQARPQHLQRLKANPVFGAIGSARTVSAIKAVLEGQPWEAPQNWAPSFCNSRWDVNGTCRAPAGILTATTRAG